jgi:hypothetical protein
MHDGLLWIQDHVHNEFVMTCHVHNDLVIHDHISANDECIMTRANGDWANLIDLTR